MDDALAICNKLIIECLGHGLDDDHGEGRPASRGSGRHSPEGQ